MKIERVLLHATPGPANCAAVKSPKFLPLPDVVREKYSITFVLVPPVYPPPPLNHLVPFEAPEFEYVTLVSKSP